MEQFRKYKARDFVNEVVFTTSRSGGPGGQNVNKVESKVTLHFDIQKSIILSPEEKQVMNESLKSKLTGEGVLVLSAQSKRTQLQNKEEVLVKFEKLLTKVFSRKKERKATSPSIASKIKRLESKKKQGEKKRWRQASE